MIFQHLTDSRTNLNRIKRVTQDEVNAIHSVYFHITKENAMRQMRRVFVCVCGGEQRRQNRQRQR